MYPDMDLTLTSNTPSPRTSRGTSNWCDLPGELRNQIYEYVLIDSEPLSIEWGGRRRIHLARRPTPLRGALVLALILTNKQTYREARPMLYSENRFHFECTRALELFMAQVKPKAVKWIKHVLLELEPRDTAPVSRRTPTRPWRRILLMQQAKKLESFVVLTGQLDNDGDDVIHVDRLATWLWRTFDVKSWMETFVGSRELSDAIDRMFTVARSFDGAGVPIGHSLTRRQRIDFRNKLKSLLANAGIVDVGSALHQILIAP